MNMCLIAQHTLFRDGIRLLLQNSGVLSESKEASCVSSALELIHANSFDLIFLEVNFYDTNSTDSLHKIKSIAPSSPIIVVSETAELRLATQAMSEGASACISKISPYTELLKAIDCVKHGKTYCSPEFERKTPCANKGTKNNTKNGVNLSALHELSDRQREVLEHIAMGESNKAISKEMNISPNTVKAHLASIFKILGVHNRTEAFYIATLAGLTDTPSGD